MNNSQIIEKSIWDIMGLENMPLKNKVTILNQLVQLVQKRIMLRLVNMLSDIELKDFSNVIDTGTQEEFGDFIQNKIPNYEDIVMEESLKVKDEMADAILQIEEDSINKEV